jgi:2-polyprenyl-3-methyl-5-hydroxy-6-metoxy-1,4-benzoquinol methylase
MIAPAEIPDRYLVWNRQHGAPSGFSVRGLRWKSKIWPKEQLLGPFSIQTNNTTRRFEYPWAFESGRVEPGMRVLEIGGSLCGFQFVLSKLGCHTVNIDPGMAAAGVGWPCDANSIKKLNRAFGTRVELINTTIDKAELKPNSFDRTFCISVIEHLPMPDAQHVMSEVHRALKPGGLFILTIDLFLNLHPFTTRQSNEYGKNLNLMQILDEKKWKIICGKKEEIFGFHEFKPETILCNLDRYLIGSYPVLIQSLVLQKII